MDRRETIKTLLVGSLAGGAVLTTGCTPGEESSKPEATLDEDPGYGRTPDEVENDKKLNDQQYFTEHELETIAVLCDFILPATPDAGSANEAGVPEFIEFISKDIPRHQLPLRGGLMWLDHHSNVKFNSVFKDCKEEDQISILDEIAYPDKADPRHSQGVQFFTLLRNLTLTGYYTTRIGFDDLGYVGNSPNIWNGVPEEIMSKHNLSLDPKYVDKYVDQSKRDVKAEWDENGKLIS